jgi:hypothetical protein
LDQAIRLVEEKAGESHLPKMAKQGRLPPSKETTGAESARLDQALRLEEEQGVSGTKKAYKKRRTVNAEDDDRKPAAIPRTSGLGNQEKKKKKWKIWSKSQDDDTKPAARPRTSGLGNQGKKRKLRTSSEES